MIIMDIMLGVIIGGIILIGVMALSEHIPIALTVGVLLIANITVITQHGNPGLVEVALICANSGIGVLFVGVGLFGSDDEETKETPK